MRNEKLTLRVLFAFTIAASCAGGCASMPGFGGSASHQDTGVGRELGSTIGQQVAAEHLPLGHVLGGLIGEKTEQAIHATNDQK